MRKVSHERNKVAKAERVVLREGNMCAVGMRDGDASPGSRTASSAKGRRWDPGGPAGTIKWSGNGGGA